MMHKNNTSFSKIKVCTLKMKHGYAPRRPEAKSGKEVKINTKLNLDYSIFIATKFNSFARRARLLSWKCVVHKVEKFRFIMIHFDKPEL